MKKDANNNALDAAALKTIAMRIEKATHNKLLEFEGSSYEANKKAPKPKSAYVTGMGARIRECKKRCWVASGKQGQAHKAEILPMDRLKSLEKVAEPGTPEGNQ